MRKFVFALRARRERPHTFPCFSTGLLAALVLVVALVASAAVPSPVPQPGPSAAMPVLAITSIQTGFLYYTYTAEIGYAERWLITGTVAPGIPGGGCCVVAIVDGNVSGYAEYQAVEYFDIGKLCYVFGVQVDVPVGYWTIVTVLAENDWLEEDREYVQLPPSLAEAPHPAWTN